MEWIINKGRLFHNHDDFLFEFIIDNNSEKPFCELCHETIPDALAMQHSLCPDLFSIVNCHYHPDRNLGDYDNFEYYRCKKSLEIIKQFDTARLTALLSRYGFQIATINLKYEKR